jgi:ribonuclease Z
LVALGTASQVPTRHRNHNGYFLRWDTHGFLFDPGDGTQRQLIHCGVSAPRITRICITHFHGDHCLGLAGIIQRLSLDRVTDPLPVYYPASGQRFFDRLRRASIFKDLTDLRPMPISTYGVVEDNEQFSLTALPLAHTVDCVGYRIEEKPRINLDPSKLSAAGLSGRMVGTLRKTGEVVGSDGAVVRLADVSVTTPGQIFAFVMDTAYCANAVALAQDADLVVCESTYLQSEAAEARERGHMTAADAARVALEAGARSLVLTHFSQRHPETAPFLEEAAQIFTGELHAVEDGDTVAVPPLRRPVWD